VWPDHGVPECGTPLLSFHNRVEKFHKRISTPMVVHCSAGVGRTGTFIVIDTQLQKIKRERCVDIFNNIRMLRYSRNYMVQTQVSISPWLTVTNLLLLYRYSMHLFMMSYWRPLCVEILQLELQYKM